MQIIKSRRSCSRCESEFNSFWQQPILASSTIQLLQRTIVTGASSNHSACLQNLLVSLEHFCPGNRVVVCDLGLSESEAETIKNIASQLKTFDFENYPPYFNIRENAGEYAWKPVIVHEVMKEFGGLILWLDAGDLVLGDLAGVWSLILRYGIVTPETPGDLSVWTHPRTLDYMSVPAKDLHKPNRNAALVGLNTNCEWARRLCLEWKDCALCRECIAPTGSDRSNHRQDQAVLSVLFYKYEREYNFAMIDEVREISFHNDLISRKQVEEMWPR